MDGYGLKHDAGPSGRPIVDEPAAVAAVAYLAG